MHNLRSTPYNNISYVHHVSVIVLSRQGRAGQVRLGQVSSGRKMPRVPFPTLVPSWSGHVILHRAVCICIHLQKWLDEGKEGVM